MEGHCPTTSSQNKVVISKPFLVLLMSHPWVVAAGYAKLKQHISIVFLPKQEVGTLPWPVNNTGGLYVLAKGSGYQKGDLKPLGNTD
jgi:hypothetical protein